MPEKKIRLVYHDSRGLHRDAERLTTSIRGHSIETITYPEIELTRNVSPMPIVDVQLFLEHIHPDALQYAELNVFIPNIEWCNTRDYSTLLQNPNILIIAKTQHALRVLRSVFKDRVAYIPWCSNDMYDPGVERSDNWLHVKGVSRFKQTHVLLRTWLKHPEWPILHIVSNGDSDKNGFLEIPVPAKISDNIFLHQRTLSHDELKTLMNACAFHICPSIVEGFGHYIHEGMSTGATVVTTNGCPMNEIVSHEWCLIDSSDTIPIRLGTGFYVNESSIERCVHAILQNDIKSESRTEWEERLKEFETRINEYLMSIS